MSDAKPPLQLPRTAEPPELSDLIESIVQKAVAQICHGELAPFMHSKACAQLIGVSPEHLCAMRARGEGPPWSGEGKWIRYERTAVLEWIRNLPRHPSPAAAGEPLTTIHDQRMDSG